MINGKDTEIWIGENRFYIGEDGILYITCVGDIDEKMALEFKDAIFKLLTTVGKKKVNTFVDINKAGKISSKARNTFNKLTEDYKSDYGSRTALVGLHPVARVIASFFMGFSKDKDTIHFYKTTEDALVWLKEEQTK